MRAAIEQAIGRSAPPALNLPWVDITDRLFGGDPAAPAAINSAALESAAAALATVGGGTIILPGYGEYEFAMPLSDTYAGGTIKKAATMRSNITIDGGGSMMRWADGVTTNGSPIATALFYSNVPLKNIVFRDLIFDLNGDNNAVDGLNLLQSAICFSGDGAYCDDLLIDNCHFLNGAGTCVVSFNQTNTPGTPIGSRNTIRNSYFFHQTSKLLVTDHSTLSGAVNDALVIGTTFEFDTVRADNIGVVWDCQGTRNMFLGCKVRKYFCGPQIGGNYVSPSSGIIVADNTLETIKGYAVNFFREVLAEQPIDGVAIDNNIISLDDSATTIDVKSAVRFVTNYALLNLSMTNNQCTKTGTTKEAVWFYGGPAQAGTVYDGITIKHNQTRGGWGGTQLNATVGDFGVVSIAGNEHRNLVLAGVETAAMAIKIIAGAGRQFAAVTLKHNDMLNDAGGTYTNGIFIQGTVVQLTNRGNDYLGMTVQNYTESGVTVTGRHGEFDNIPYTPVWSASGTPITLGNGTSTGHYDIRDGRMSVRAVLVLGSTTVLPPGTLTYSLPVVSIGFGNQYLGAWRIVDQAGPTFYLGTAEIDGTASVGAMEISGATNVDTVGHPVALVAGSSVAVDISYLAAG